MAPRACKGTTKKGDPCKGTPLSAEKGDPDYCLAHQPEEVKESLGFGGAQEGAGRPRLPRPHEVLRERVESDIEKWLSPLEEALEADRGVVVGSGDSAELEMVPDYAVRLKAHEMALDRVYGRPRQAVEHSGPDGGEIPMRAPDTSDAKVREHLTAALAAAAAAEAERAAR